MIKDVALGRSHEVIADEVVEGNRVLLAGFEGDLLPDAGNGRRAVRMRYPEALSAVGASRGIEEDGPIPVTLPADYCPVLGRFLEAHVRKWQGGSRRDIVNPDGAGAALCDVEVEVDEVLVLHVLDFAGQRLPDAGDHFRLHLVRLASVLPALYPTSFYLFEPAVPDVIILCIHRWTGKTQGQAGHGQQSMGDTQAVCSSEADTSHFAGAPPSRATHGNR